jgi:hypothetical protein
MNGYVTFYKGKRFEVHAETKLKAQLKAAEHFNTTKTWLIAIELAEVDGVQVVHKPMM